MLDIDTDDLRALLDTHPDEPVLSLYLPVDPRDPENQRTRGSERWRVQLRNDLGRLEGDVTERNDKEARAHFEGCVRQAESFVEHYFPGGRSVAVLADPSAVLHVEVPVVLAQRAGYGPPLVRELVRAMSDHRLYAAVLVDRESYRFLTGFLGFVQDEAALDLRAPYGMPGPTRSGHHFRFEARREKYQRRFQGEVADMVERFLRENPEVERLVVGGNETEAHGVARSLSPEAHQKLMGVVPIPIRSSDAEVTARVAPHARRFEEELDLEELGRVMAAKRTGRGLFGPEPVLDALSRSAARDLYVSSHLADAELVERLTRGAVASGAAVRFLHRAAATALDEEGGVAARLYYAPGNATST